MTAIRKKVRSRMPREEREQQLLDIAESLFTVHGVTATSVEDIARAAGVTRPMLYNHFGDLEGVLLACVQRARTDFQRQLVGVISALPDRTDLVRVLETGGNAFFSLLEANPRRWALLFTNTTATSGKFSERMTDLRFGTTETIVEIARTIVPSADDLRLRAAAHAISGAAEQLGRFWLREPALSRGRIVQYFREFTSGIALSILADAEASSRGRAPSKKR
jgi:AcrR family transcriptional regulator